MSEHEPERREKHIHHKHNICFYGHFSFLVSIQSADRQALKLHLHVFRLINERVFFPPRYVVRCKHAYNFYRYMISLLLFVFFSNNVGCEAGCDDLYIPVFIHFHTHIKSLAQAILYD